MGKKYSKEDLLNIIQNFEEEHDRLPTKRDIRSLGMDDKPFYRVFGSLVDARHEYGLRKCGFSEEEPEIEIPSNKISKTDAMWEKLRSSLSEREVKALVDSMSSGYPTPKIIHNPTEQYHFKFIATGDSHMGHKEFREDWWYAMIDHAVSEKVECMLHTGDMLEGMSGRPGHVYELAHIGFENQFKLAKQMFSDCPFSIYGINGNHDQWYAGKGDQGIDVGARLSESLSNFHYLGNQEADLLFGSVKVKLWHGMDGASYAYSYRTQKFVEQLTGGEKPHILLAGHAHKSIFYQTRNVNVLETGTTCGQTGFMRGKKLAAHTGYWIVECWANDEGIVRIRPEWCPFY